MHTVSAWSWLRWLILALVVAMVALTSIMRTTFPSDREPDSGRLPIMRLELPCSDKDFTFLSGDRKIADRSRIREGQRLDKFFIPVYSLTLLLTCMLVIRGLRAGPADGSAPGRRAIRWAGLSCLAAICGGLADVMENLKIAEVLDRLDASSGSVTPLVTPMVVTSSI